MSSCYAGRRAIDEKVMDVCRLARKANPDVNSTTVYRAIRIPAGTIGNMLSTMSYLSNGPDLVLTKEMLHLANGYAGLSTIEV